MKAPQLLILADDLTGAADTAGYFARAGLQTLVRFAPGKGAPAEVLALSTHSRHLSPDEAAQAQHRALAELGEVGGAEWIYKKVDSTLRGHPAAELQAIMVALGSTRALIAPAFPQQGRTTVEGRQLVEGQPLEQTSFGGNSDLLDLFAQAEYPVWHLGLDTVRRGGEELGSALTAEGLYVGDAQGEEDLRCLVQGAAEAGIRLLCGSAGLARALQERALLHSVLPAPALPEWDAGPVLVVAGSRHPLTLRQVQALGQAGALILGLGSASCEQAQRALGDGRDVVLHSAGLESGDPETVASGLALMAREIISASPVGGLVLTGGDIALAVCAALESTGMWLHGEVEPGIPWGTLADGPWAGLRVVTKAGGFGSEGSLVQAVQLLRHRQS
ncbi:MAG: four-carbon acid sugar kinase family protein [Candidatus Latescibacteria bacterium]|nr:four-carbon acid sugar kinase family protein [Candidatus Latescibacterota bacterium]